VSSFIGREAELAAVRALVAGSRLVTLTGAGGAGKTRLGLQVAAGLLDGAADEVWFADLAPLADPDLVAVTVADVLGVRQEPGRPAAEAVVAAVGRRSLLVLLDNCEHVIGACAELADALLRDCPNLVLLATSREPLGIDGERVYRVPPMRTPADDDDTDAIRSSEAVLLFTHRAEQHGGDAGLGRGDSLGHRAHLPAAGWHAAGHGAGRGAAAGDGGGGAGGPAG
jgi:predicted ATPase